MEKKYIYMYIYIIMRCISMNNTSGGCSGYVEKKNTLVLRIGLRVYMYAVWL
jgi:hypothetical protein